MKILQIFSKVPYPVKDGGSVAVTSMSEGFARAGNTVDILCLNTNKHFVKIPEIQKQIPENINLKAVNINTDIKPSAMLKNLIFSKKPYNAERFISEKFKKLLIETLKKNKYDIIQTEGLFMMPYLNTVRKYSKAHISFRAHNIEHEILYLNLKQEKNIIKKIYLKNLSSRLKKFEISFINKYDSLIPITQRDADIFIKLGNTKPVHVCPAGINTDKYKNTKPDFSEIKLFHLGSLDWTPNTEGILWFLENVWNNLIIEFPNIKFTVAGRNASEKFIKKITSYKNIIYKGEIENSVKFIAEHNVMLVPLLSGSGMRIKIIEGMACGNIIISTKKGAEGINAKPDKEIIIADTPEQFIEKIKLIIQRKKIQPEKISNNAKQFISVNFDNFAISKSLIKFYEKQIK